MDEALIKARQEFTPVPAKMRKSPGRIKSIPARLYINKYVEHKAAFDFLDDVVNSGHGDGIKTLVRALLYYQETVFNPLQELRNKDITATVPRNLLIAVTEFTLMPKGNVKDVKNIGARLYIDKYVEHRQAYHFLQEVQKTYSEGNKVIIRALLHYKEAVYEPLQKELELNFSHSGFKPRITNVKRRK